MPNKLMLWNDKVMNGIPTKSVIVNEVINEVKMIDVCKQE